VKERPILFSAPMVSAILEGKKTQTRRVIKNIHGWPYGIGNDRLWVKETFISFPEEVAPKIPRPTKWSVYYEADGDIKEVLAPAAYNPTMYNYYRTTPSIFMPRWASRIILDIKSLEIAQRQDISESDAISEGVSSREEFKSLWNSLNDKKQGRSWEDNPMVWVISFERLKNSKDEM